MTSASHGSHENPHRSSPLRFRLPVLSPFDHHPSLGTTCPGLHDRVLLPPNSPNSNLNRLAIVYRTRRQPAFSSFLSLTWAHLHDTLPCLLVQGQLQPWQLSMSRNLSSPLLSRLQQEPNTLLYNVEQTLPNHARSSSIWRPQWSLTTPLSTRRHPSPPGPPSSARIQMAASLPRLSSRTWWKPTSTSSLLGSSSPSSFATSSFPCNTSGEGRSRTNCCSTSY